MSVRARIREIGIAMLPALVALCFGGPGWAQDSTKVEAKNPLKPGVWALEIEAQGTLFSPGSAIVAGKKHLKERSAIEAGISLDLSETETDGKSTYFLAFPSDTTTDVAPTDQRTEQDLVGLFVHYVGYAQVWDRVALLWGVGPVGQWNSVSLEGNSYLADGSYSHASTDQHIWGVGLGAIIGFEWFFAGRLSLGGRAGITGLYEQGSQERSNALYNASGLEYNSATETEDIDRVSVSTNATTLILSLYF